MSSTLEQRAEHIEEEERMEITSAFKRLDGKMYANRTDLTILFKAFDKYIETYPLKNMDCNSCRVAILTFWRRVVRIWE
tara:strand:+ start:1242 stop:1478 length:237 start_codon:yes stop_codon:yes gene_type:complete